MKKHGLSEEEFHDMLSRIRSADHVDLLDRLVDRTHAFQSCGKKATVSGTISITSPDLCT